MQTWITDIDFYKSASNLNRQHLQSTIYEVIHILASLLDVNDKLVNPKRNVKNHPAAKLWDGYEKELYDYILIHYNEWIENRNFRSEINMKNICLLGRYIYGITGADFYHHIGDLLNPDWFNPSDFQTPLWITDELIATHRSVLIQKEIEKENQIMIARGQIFNSDKWSLKYHYRFEEKIKNNYHYRNLWPNTPTNLNMHYNWRKI